MRDAESRVIKFSLSEETDLPLLLQLDSMKKHEKSRWIKTALFLFLILHQELLKREMTFSEMEKAIYSLANPLACDGKDHFREREKLKEVINSLLDIFEKVSKS